MRSIKSVLAPLSPLPVLLCLSVTARVEAQTDNFTRLTVYQLPNFQGKSTSLTLNPENEHQLSQTIVWEEIAASDYDNKLGSAKIECGSRKSQVSFSDSSKDFGHRIVLACDVQESKSIEFSEVKADGDISLENRVNWFQVLVHADHHGSANIGPSLAKRFSSIMPKFLPAKIKATGSSQANYIDESHVELFQNLVIDDPVCKDAQVSFAYLVSIRLTDDDKDGLVEPEASIPSHSLTFAEGSEACQTLYRSPIDNALVTANNPLADMLEVYSKGEKTTYYLSSGAAKNQVIANWGDEK